MNCQQNRLFIFYDCFCVTHEFWACFYKNLRFQNSSHHRFYKFPKWFYKLKKSYINWKYQGGSQILTGILNNTAKIWDPPPKKKKKKKKPMKIMLKWKTFKFRFITFSLQPYCRLSHDLTSSIELISTNTHTHTCTLHTHGIHTKGSENVLLAKASQSLRNLVTFPKKCIKKQFFQF